MTNPNSSLETDKKESLQWLPTDRPPTTVEAAKRGCVTSGMSRIVFRYCDVVRRGLIPTAVGLRPTTPQYVVVVKLESQFHPLSLVPCFHPKISPFQDPTDGRERGLPSRHLEQYTTVPYFFYFRHSSSCGDGLYYVVAPKIDALVTNCQLLLILLLLSAEIVQQTGQQSQRKDFSFSRSWQQMSGAGSQHNTSFSSASVRRTAVIRREDYCRPLGNFQAAVAGHVCIALPGFSSLRFPPFMLRKYLSLRCTLPQYCHTKSIVTL